LRVHRTRRSPHRRIATTTLDGTRSSTPVSATSARCCANDPSSPCPGSRPTAWSPMPPSWTAATSSTTCSSTCTSCASSYSRWSGRPRRLMLAVGGHRGALLRDQHRLADGTDRPRRSAARLPPAEPEGRTQLRALQTIRTRLRELNPPCPPNAGSERINVVAACPSCPIHSSSIRRSRTGPPSDVHRRI